MTVFETLTNPIYWAFTVGATILVYWIFEVKFEGKKGASKEYTRKTTANKPLNGFQRFFKYHMNGLKGMNRPRYRATLREMEQHSKKNQLFEKMTFYTDIGDTDKARAIGKKIARMDGF